MCVIIDKIGNKIYSIQKYVWRYEDRYIRTRRFITYTSRCKDASGFILFIDANEISRQTSQVKYVSSRLFSLLPLHSALLLQSPFTPSLFLPFSLSFLFLSLMASNIKRYKVEFILSLIISGILRCYSHDPAVTLRKCYSLRYFLLLRVHRTLYLCAHSQGTFVLHRVSINCAFPPSHLIYMTPQRGLCEEKKKTKKISMRRKSTPHVDLLPG